MHRTVFLLSCLIYRALASEFHVLDESPSRYPSRRQNQLDNYRSFRPASSKHSSSLNDEVVPRQRDGPNVKSSQNPTTGGKVGNLPRSLLELTPQNTTWWCFGADDSAGMESYTTNQAYLEQVGWSVRVKAGIRLIKANFQVFDGTDSLISRLYPTRLYPVDVLQRYYTARRSDYVEADKCSKEPQVL